MNNLQASCILTGTVRPMSDRAASAEIAMARNPRQIRLGEGSRYPPSAHCPQILWIKVCVSCKLGR
jgi:hypothetical protein